MDATQIKRNFITPELSGFDSLVELQWLELRLILLYGQLLSLDALLDLLDELLADGILLSNCFHNPVIQLVIHLP